MKIAGLDIGTTGCKLTVFDENGAELSKAYNMDIIASGGVSSLSDVKALRALELYGAIIGKAYYTGAINLKEALEAAK